MLEKMVSGWFNKDKSLNEFGKAMFMDDLRSINVYMNKVALNTFSYLSDFIKWK